MTSVITRTLTATDPMPEPPDHVHLVRDEATGVEAVRARFAAHAYDAHRHDDWLVGVTERGVQDFFCRGARQRSTAGRVILIEPDEAHDGQAGAPGGFAYRMLYLPQRWLRSGLADVGGGDPGFATCLHDDRALGTAIHSASAALFQPDERLASDAALDAVLLRLRPHFGRPVRTLAARRDCRVARRAREFLHDTLTANVGADALARSAGASDRFHLARSFRAAYGTSPHAYLVQIRLVRARHLLASGERPADVAAACGFADQSHLGRRFRRAYGLTPATYRALCTGVPDRPAGNA
ncbi:AraC family transcriptional regulator [Teichococcus vastitatis]|uniref:AraC family transcriptional regulator n=1 Tax=Teichococcus vastitatis TaxID=2307076 RepID=A0ABS9W6T5_9PROT|nr:AraC family transcriptional regulator [Pseudoroseomonas vastitatis]MCI0754933.1 AraC family transcriptional regulator [Pseudoroseomonas vastitatis]